jgi:hypothetical protein
MDKTKLQLMMLDIDGVLTRHHATATDVLAAAQQLAVSALGDITNKSLAATGGDAAASKDQTEALHRAADAIAEQIREALHKRIDEGERDDWLIER